MSNVMPRLLASTLAFVIPYIYLVIPSEARNLKSLTGERATTLDSSLRCAAFRMTEWRIAVLRMTEWRIVVLRMTEWRMVVLRMTG